MTYCAVSLPMNYWRLSVFIAAEMDYFTSFF